MKVARAIARGAPSRGSPFTLALVFAEQPAPIRPGIAISDLAAT